MDLQTNIRDLSLMEPATVVQVIARGNATGIQIGHPVFSNRPT